MWIRIVDEVRMPLMTGAGCSLSSVSLSSVSLEVAGGDVDVVDVVVSGPNPLGSPDAKWMWFLVMRRRPPLCRMSGHARSSVPWMTELGMLLAATVIGVRRPSVSILILWPWLARIR
ncbi:hypothetical protein M3J07_013123 [Ascochyta lentis]